MGTDRLKRVNELLKREIADMLYRVLNDQGIDLSALTVTHVLTSPDLRRARVMVSITGDDARKRAYLSIIRRHRKEVQHLMSKHVKLKYTPRLNFEIDPSLAAGDHVLQILHEMEADDPALAEQETAPEEPPQPE